MHILVVAEDAVAGMLEPLLSQWRFSVTARSSGHQAIQALAGQHADMVIATVSLPDMNADTFCRHLRSIDRGRSYLLMLGEMDMSPDMPSLLESGMDDFLNTPVDENLLRIKAALAHRMSTLSRELDRKLSAIGRNYYQSVRTLAQLIDTHNPPVGAHCRRVGRLALALARRSPGVPAEDYPVIEAAGALHDIGLIGLPLPVLYKRRTELNGKENSLYRTHPERGEAILKQMDLLRPVARIVRMHHEQHNGRGFPDGMSGDRIPLGAAIVGAASWYDDLVHREKKPMKQMPEHLQRLRGYQLRPELVALLLDVNLKAIQDEARQTDYDVSIDDLAEGMVLAREVLMKSGAFCMAADTVMDTALIRKLMRYHEMGNISDKIFIKK